MEMLLFIKNILHDKITVDILFSFIILLVIIYYKYFLKKWDNLFKNLTRNETVEEQNKLINKNLECCNELINQSKMIEEKINMLIKNTNEIIKILDKMDNIDEKNKFEILNSINDLKISLSKIDSIIKS